MTRQQRWQIKMRAADRCIICGQPESPTRSGMCPTHAARDAARVLRGYYRRKAAS